MINSRLKLFTKNLLGSFDHKKLVAQYHPNFLNLFHLLFTVCDTQKCFVCEYFNQR